MIYGGGARVCLYIYLKRSRLNYKDIITILNLGVGSYRPIAFLLLITGFLAFAGARGMAQTLQGVKDTAHTGSANAAIANGSVKTLKAPPDSSDASVTGKKKIRGGKHRKDKTAELPDTTRSKTRHRLTTEYYEPAMQPSGAGYSPGKVPHGIDTGLDNFEVYTDQYTLGNTGSPVVPLIFQGQPDPLGFFYGNQYLGTSFCNDSSIKYYNSRAPYLGFLYVSDPKIQEFFDMWYTQNIGRKLNVSFGFRRIRDEGFYTNQGTNLNQVTLTGNYHSRHYVAFANFIYDVFELHQNGGIAADSDFFNPNYSNRQAMPVNLNSAIYMMRQMSFHLKQYFLFGYRRTDSAEKKPRFYLSHSITLSRQSIAYSDPGPLDSLFYHNPYFNSGLLTYDSLHISQIINDVSIGSMNPASPFLHWQAGITNQWAHIIIPGHVDSIFSLNIVHACLYDTGKYLYRVQGSGIAEGRSLTGDYQGSAQIGFAPDSLHTLWLKGSNSSEHPAFIYNEYYGNNFQWQNNFNKTGMSSLALIYNDAKWKLNFMIQATDISNMTYFGSNQMPAQYSKPVQVLAAQFGKVFSVGKWGWKTVEIYQYVPDSAPLHVPQFVSVNSIYYQNYLFHRHLLMRMGVDVYFNTAFYADGYMPVYNQYYLQNETKIGNYACIDPFVSFRIKTFRLFLKFENAGAGLLQPNLFYGYADNYPINDMVMRFGLSWDFWN